MLSMVTSLSPGDQGWRTLSVGHWFFSIFNNARKNNGRAVRGTIARGNTDALITVHAQGQNMWPSPGPGTKSPPDSKYLKTVADEVRCSCEEFKPCQHEIATDEIQEDDKIERAAI